MLGRVEYWSVTCLVSLATRTPTLIDICSNEHVHITAILIEDTACLARHIDSFVNNQQNEVALLVVCDAVFSSIHTDKQKHFPFLTRIQREKICGYYSSFCSRNFINEFLKTYFRIDQRN